MEPYEYAAIVLPGIDVKEAIRITRKGIAANPSSWRLHQHLGYIYWQQQDYEAAREHLPRRRQTYRRSSLDGGDAGAHGR